jgi:glutamate formiminotransferase
VYDSTSYNLASLFYINYPINLENYKKYPIYKIFPNILQKYEPKNYHINNTKAKTSTIADAIPQIM